MRVKAIINGGEIRRFSLGEKERTYSSLEGKLKALFSLPEETPLQVSYYDEEGDEVVFSTDDEMATFSLEQVLKLYVKVTSAPASAPAPAPTTPTPTPTPTTIPTPAPAPASQIPPNLLPPQPGIIFSASPFAPSSTPSSAPPPPYRSAPPSPRTFTGDFTFATNVNPRRLIKFLMLFLLLAALASAMILSTLFRAYHSYPSFSENHRGPSSSSSHHHNRHPHHHHHHPQHAEQGFDDHDPHHQFRQMLFHQAGGALFLAFCVSAVLAFILAAIATYLFSRSISSFAASFPQNPQLRQQRINEFWAALSQLFQTFTQPQPFQQQQQQQVPLRNQNAPTGQNQNQNSNASQESSQQHQNSATNAQFQPPPYEGIRHRSPLH